MADRKITLRRNNSGTSEAMYPTTTVDQIMAINGTDAAFDANGKLQYSHLPDGIIGGLKFQHTITAAQTDQASEIAAEIESAVAAYGIDGVVGSYWIASNEQTWYDAQSYENGGSTNSYGWTVHAPNEEDNGGGTGLTAEAGDWIVITEFALNSGSNYDVTLGVINNNYRDATTTARGVVELATDTETSTGTDTTRAVTPAGLASVLTGYSTTDNDTTYSISVGGFDDAPTIVLTAGGSGSGTDSISFSAGDNVALNIVSDDIEIVAEDNYLDGITKADNTLTFSVGNKSDVTYTFGSNAFNSTTIPSVTLNGSVDTSPNFYAPTASGAAGTSSVSRQALFSAGSGSAPTWVDAPKIFYDTTTGWLHGDIVFDVDAP